MRVVEAEAGGTGQEGDRPPTVGRDEGRAFFRSAVHIGRDELTMPMQLLGRVGVVTDVDGDALAFFQAEHRTWKLAVVRSGGDNVLGRNLEWRLPNRQGIVRLRALPCVRQGGRKQRRSRESTCCAKECAARYWFVNHSVSLKNFCSVTPSEHANEAFAAHAFAEQ